MKKNYMMRIASVLLVVILLTTCAISATFAKYTATGTGTDTASIATWDVKYNGVKISETLSFGLFDTITNTGAAGSVAEGVIAPGTSGTFTVTLDNDSQVAAKYAVSFDTPENVPLTFEVVGTQTNTLAVGADPVTVTINWEWPFETENGDAADTALAGQSLTVDVTVDVEQVD